MWCLWFVRNRRANGKEQKIPEHFLRFLYQFMMKRKRRKSIERIRKKRKRGSISTDMKRRRIRSMINRNTRKRNTKRKRRNTSFGVFVAK